MPVKVNHVSSCRPNRFAVLPLDIITHSSFVRKQVVATSMCCYLSPALSNGLICSHTLMILLSSSLRLCVVNHTVLICLSCYDHTYHEWRLDHRLITYMVGPQSHCTPQIIYFLHNIRMCGRSVLSQILTTFFSYQRLSN